MFEECDLPLGQFDNTEEWIHHMMWQHTIRFSCQFAGHEDFSSDTRARFLQHLDDHHPGSLLEDQRETIVQKALQPVPDVIAALPSSLVPAGTPTGELRLCPLCDFSAEVPEPFLAHSPDLEIGRLPDEVHKEIRDHIATHLKTVALLCLPARDDFVDDYSSELHRGISDSSMRRTNATHASDEPCTLDDEIFEHVETEEGIPSEPVMPNAFIASQFGVEEDNRIYDEPVLLHIAQGQFTMKCLNEPPFSEPLLQQDIFKVHASFSRCPEELS